MDAAAASEPWCRTLLEERGLRRREPQQAFSTGWTRELPLGISDPDSLLVNRPPCIVQL